MARGVEWAGTRLRTQRATRFSCSMTIRPGGVGWGGTSEPHKKREEQTGNVCQREGGTKSHPLQISISLC